MDVSSPEKVSAHSSGKSPEQLRKDRLWLGTVISAVLLAVSVVLVSPTVIEIHDKNHRVVLECTVIDAEAGTSSGGSRSSAPRPQVSVKTSDCGPFMLQEGIDESNLDDVAAELAEGGRFSFEVGEATQKLQWLNLQRTVWSFQQID